MCGRYASSRRPEDLIEEFEVDLEPHAEPLEADYNVAPTKEVYAVVERPRTGGARERQLRVLRGDWCRRGPRSPRSAAG
jgi:putative SOS response-associated peptidase YedK